MFNLRNKLINSRFIFSVGQSTVSNKCLRVVVSDLTGLNIRLNILFLLSATVAAGQAAVPLKLEQTIELPDVQGRIDHMSLDAAGQRLFVSALGNNTVEVIDLKVGKRTNTISGLKEPQGALYVANKNRLFIASGKDGTVKLFDATSLQLLKTTEYGDDADNLRYDTAHERVYVGFGDGALGELDTEGQKIAETKLDAHPESFQLEKGTSRIYVNLPGSRKVAVADREHHSVVTTWGMGLTLGNYAMALDEADHRLFVVSREPARLVVMDTATGKVILKLPAVGDCDDIFWDASRKRIYATGGEGAISVFEQQDPDHYREMARIPTVKGARTSFFSPDLGRLYVALRRQGSTPAAIQVFTVVP
jgi:DNA-binding beta-propeller fold protein YncE